MTPDTLRADTTLIREWAQSGDYDYAQNLHARDKSLLETLFEKLGEWLDDLVSIDTGNIALDDVKKWISVAAACAATAFFIYFLWKRRKNLKRRPKAEDLPYEVTEDTIYVADFDAALEKALAASNYREAVRLIYFRTLRHLHDSGHLTWNATQTPEEFVCALTDAGMRSLFARLTNHYVRIRYGHFEATPADVRLLLQNEERLRTNGKEGGTI